MADTQQPNIVFILIDDLRFDTFGFMGHPFVETPHIDSLATNGMQFTSAFVTTSLCSPARASFLTGQYMHNHRVVSNSDLMPTGTRTFPMYLQAAGYQTAFLGKWHMGGSSDAPRPGFDHWVSFRGQGDYHPENQTLNVDGELVPRTKYMTDELTDYAERWLSQRTADEPFMLYLTPKGVHGLYDPALRHCDRYKEVSWQPPPTMAGDVAADSGKPMWVQDQSNSWDTDELYDIKADPHETTNLIRAPEHQQRVRTMRQQLHDQLEHTDGLLMPLGNKRGHGSNQRSRSGSRRAEFPECMLQED